MPVVVDIRDVSMTIGTVQVLAPVRVHVQPGTIVAVTGPNGAGKTTLLRIVLGRDAPTQGQVVLADAAARRPGIASVTDVPPFYRDLTVREHLDLVAASWRGDPGLGDADAIVDRLRIRPILDQFPAELSSGERRLAALTCALLRPAALLVLDEPEQRLDAARREALASLLVERAQQDCGVLMATHDSALCDAVTDHVVRLGARG